MVAKKEIWVTAEGYQFDTKEEAERHEARETLQQHILTFLQQIKSPAMEKPDYVAARLAEFIAKEQSVKWVDKLVALIQKASH